MNLHVMAERIAFFLVRRATVEADQVKLYRFGPEVLAAATINGVLKTTIGNH